MHMLQVWFVLWYDKIFNMFVKEWQWKPRSCNTPHLGDALRANFGLKVEIILFYQELKVDFLLDLNFCFDFDTVT